MRESIGGAYQFGMMLTFIAIFIAFLAFSVNYAHAFRVKNEVINIVEQYGGFNVDSSDKIKEYLNSVGYYPWVGNSVSIDQEIAEMVVCEITPSVPGYGSYQVCKITTLINFSLPLVGQVMSLNIPITGSTKLIYVR